MARARNIKPSIFKNEILGTADPLCTLLFESLWLLADREGRLEDRPLRIKAETFPYRENINIESLLGWLSDNGFIIRYQYRENRYIEIINFTKHQNPHKNEPESTIPSCFNDLCIVRSNSVQVPKKSEPLGLIPDSLNLIPDSLNTDSLIPDSLNLIPEIIAPDKSDAQKELNQQIWKSYQTAYFNRYKVEPIRNAKVNKQVSELGKRLGIEAICVASFYVRVNDSFLIKKMHDFGSLLAGAEGYRTQWATGKAVTSTQARQADRLQATHNSVDETMEILRQERG